MANPSGNQNRKQTDPTLTDLLSLHKKEIMMALNCHAVGTIQSFDPDQQTVTATINYKKSVLQPGPDGVYQAVLIDYPLLMDLPIVILSGGVSQLTFPIAVGDECLILFNDRDIDNWFQSGQIGPLASNRLHSFADGFALVGVRSFVRALDGYDMTHAVLAYGTTKVAVGEKIGLSNETDSLNALLQELINEIKNLVSATATITVLCASPGSPSSVPVNAALISAISATLTTTATKIAGLLE